MQVTLMMTPEMKVESHHLLGPSPIVSLREDLPSHILSSGRSTVSRHSSVAG